MRAPGGIWASVDRVPTVPAPSRFHLPWPAAARAGEDLVGIGADLAPGTLLAGFRSGVFPMPIDPRRRRSKLAWYSPDPRGVLPLDGLRVSRSLRRSIHRFDVRMNTEPEAVIASCADPARRGQWITEELANAYHELWRLGWLHTVEIGRSDQLVGGLFGVRIERCFIGLSMFHDATDASKVALVHLTDWLRSTDASLLDVQWATPHLASLGAIEVERRRYLETLADATQI